MKVNRFGKRIFMCAAIFLLLVVLVFTAAYLKSVADYKKAVRETTIDSVELSGIPDGVYVGAYDVDFISAKVEVTVRDGEMTDIVILEHRQERGKAAEAVVGDMLAEQKIDVDAVSGATNSSTVIKKAVENALLNAIN